MNELSTPQRKVAAKVLRQNGYSTREIEEWLGISDTTVLRAEKEPTNEEMKQFEALFKEAVLQKKQEGLGMVLKRMQEIVPKYPRLDHLVKAAEYFEGIRGGTSINIAGDKIIAILGEMKAE